jgi:hypothetical protein
MIMPHLNENANKQELSETANDVILRLDYLAGFIELLDNSKFIRFGDSWVYPEVLKAQKPLGFFTDEKAHLTHLSLPEQIVLQDSMANSLGFRPRLGSFKENFELAYSKDGKMYLEKVLNNFFIFTYELIGKSKSFTEVREVKNAMFIDKDEQMPDQVFTDEDYQNINLNCPASADKRLFQTRYAVGPIVQEEAPTNEGYFEDFKVIPTNKDIRQSGRGYCYPSNYDTDCFSAVQCFWFEKHNVLALHATEPLNRNFGVCIPIWTDENPKK